MTMPSLPRYRSERDQVIFLQRQRVDEAEHLIDKIRFFLTWKLLREGGLAVLIVTSAPCICPPT